MPKISVVLPSYNGADFIRDSINSVINQSFLDWELIVVDDCSSDKTYEIARGYEGQDSRIKAIHNEINKGLPGALNVGFRAASGEYLTWTSDDNIYHKDALLIMGEYLANHNEKMVCAQMIMTDMEDRHIGFHKGCFFPEIFYRANVGACFLYRREIYDEIGEYDETRFGVEDYDYWIRIARRFGNIACIDKVLYTYRQHDGTLTVARQDMVHRELIRMRHDYLDFLIDEIKNHKNFLSGMYYDFLEYEGYSEEIEYKFLEYLPEIRYDNPVEEGKPIAIYGAGKIGKKTMDFLGDEIKLIVDKNYKNLPKAINGISVIGTDEFLEKQDDYCLLVCIGRETIFSVLKELNEEGVKTMSSCYRVIPYQS